MMACKSTFRIPIILCSPELTKMFECSCNTDRVQEPCSLHVGVLSDSVFKILQPNGNYMLRLFYHSLSVNVVFMGFV
jgi:hypothetical protein